MADIELVKKSPTEYFSQEIDFTGRLLSSDKITSCTITAKNINNLQDMTNLVLGNTVGVINQTGKRVSYLLRNGILGEEYEIKFVCLTNLGYRIEDKFTLMIR